MSTETRSERIEQSYRIIFFGVFAAAAAYALGYATVAGFEALVHGGGGEYLGLNALAAIMAVSWMPMFMPVLIPVVAALVVAWAVGFVVIASSRRAVDFLSHRATSATLAWRHAHPAHQAAR